MSYLADTNIFLEILLSQSKMKECKKFINENVQDIFLSDFSLHSLGVILFRNGSAQSFSKFSKDIFNSVKIISLQSNSYPSVSGFHNKSNLDFDDSYQLCLAVEKNLELVTMDKDFLKLKKHFKIKMI